MSPLIAPRASECWRSWSREKQDAEFVAVGAYLVADRIVVLIDLDV